MKVLYLIDEWPIPTTTGAKVHDKIMMKCLLEDWAAEVSCWFEPERPESFPALPDTNTLVRKRLSWSSIPLAILRLLLARVPLHTGEFLSSESQTALRRILSDANPQVIVLSSPRLAAIVPFIRRSCRARIIVDTHDVHVQRCRSIIDALSPMQLGERIKQLLLVRSYGIIEKEIYKQVDVAWALKLEDKELLDFRSVATVDIVPNVADPDMLPNLDAELLAVEKDSTSCVFVGDYSYAPNEQCALIALDWFKDPRIMALGVKLYLIGVNPTDAMLKAAQGCRNVEITGKVPSLTEYYRPVDAIFLAPLLAGGGVKRKVIEAMVCGCPVITTTVGAEGLDLSDGETALIREVGDFAEAILDLVGNRQRRIELAFAGQDHINLHFGFDKLRGLVRASIKALNERAPL